MRQTTVLLPSFVGQVAFACASSVLCMDSDVFGVPVSYTRLSAVMSVYHIKTSNDKITYGMN
jgi:hypothetical protein